MADGTKIEWSDATWNIITGCSIVSPGCTHCYAMKLAGTRLKHHPSRKGLTTMTKTGPVWNGEVRFNEGWLKQPLQWTRPRMVFVCAHGDLFHEDVPDEWIDKVFDVMGRAQQHTFQVLTKRAERLRAWADKAVVNHQLCSGDGCNYCGGAEGRVRWKDHPFPNVWLGVSAERQKEADERIPDLLLTPAATRFVSLEPLLGPIDLTNIGGSPAAHGINAITEYNRTLRGVLDWIIVGGESGDGASPMHPDWVRSLRDQCAAAGKLDRFFFKQWGAWAPALDADGTVRSEGHGSHGAILAGDRWEQFKRGDRHGDVFLLGKKRAGRLLDGVEHNGIPV